MNCTLTPGIYWIKPYGGSRPIKTFTCNKSYTYTSVQRWTNPYIDNTGKNIVRGEVNYIWSNYQHRGAAFNIKFYTGTGYACGRVRVCVSSTCVLPVEFASFTVSQGSGMADLEWTTASEKDAYIFEIQRSIDGINFVGVATVKAVGNSQVMQKYAASISLRGLSGMQYFRVVEKNKEGMVSSVTETRVVYVEGNREVRIVPNPNRGVFQLMWGGSKGEDAASYVITNAVGAVVKRGEVRSEEAQVIDLSTLSKGVYYVTVMDEEDTFIEKLVLY